jgi:hypothetical protein
MGEDGLYRSDGGEWIRVSEPLNTTVTESDKTGSAAAKKLAETIVRRANEGVQTGLGVTVNFNPTGLVTLIDMYLDEAREAGRQEMASYVNNFCARSPLCSESFEP